MNESGRTVYNFLATCAQATPKGIADETHLSSSTVKEALKRLVACGLVRQIGYGLYAMGDGSLEEAANSTGADLVAARQRNQIAAERRAYGQYLIERQLAELHQLDLLGRWNPLNSMQAVDLMTGELVQIEDIAELVKKRQGVA